MKTKELIKQIWKDNKKGYLISGIVLTLGCLLLYGVHKSPLQYSIPFAWLGSGVFMFVFGFIIYGGRE